jgi:transposase-like protein
MKGRKTKTGGQSKYGQAFRDQVARDYESGNLSYREITSKYDLPSHHLVKWWVRTFRKKAVIEVQTLPPMKAEKKEDQKALNKRIAELEKRLADAELRALAYDTMIDVAEEQLGVEIRKKSGTKQSNSSGSSR